MLKIDANVIQEEDQKILKGKELIQRFIVNTDYR